MLPFLRPIFFPDGVSRFPLQDKNPTSLLRNGGYYFSIDTPGIKFVNPKIYIN
jgi:hypothetical protein